MQCAPAHVPQHECQTLTPAPPLRPVTALRPGERDPRLPKQWAATPPAGERGCAGSAAAAVAVGCLRALWPTGRPAGPARPGSCHRHHWSCRLQSHQRSACKCCERKPFCWQVCRWIRSNQLPAGEAAGCAHPSMYPTISRYTSSQQALHSLGAAAVTIACSKD